MRRLLAAPLLVALALAACASSGEPSPGATATGPTSSGPSTITLPPTPSPTGSPSPLPTPELELPADAPRSVEDPTEIARIDAGDHAAILPPGAEETAAVSHMEPGDPIEQIAVAWRRGADPFASEVGLVVWQRFDQTPEWRAIYAFTDRPRVGVLGVHVAAADLTADGVDDLLTEEQRGGSGACATWRVIASADGSATEILRHEGCDTEISAVDGSLEILEAVFQPGDPHCCPSAYSTTVLAWDGLAWKELSSELEPVP